jgi:hypothetical protein
VKDAADEDRAAGKVGPAQRNQQRHVRAGAAADQVGRSADDSLEERDRVRRHQLIGDRPLHVRGPPVAAPLRRENVEVRRQGVEVRCPGARISSSGMEQRE